MLLVVEQVGGVTVAAIVRQGNRRAFQDLWGAGVFKLNHTVTGADTSHRRDDLNSPVGDSDSDSERVGQTDYYLPVRIVLVAASLSARCNMTSRFICFSTTST
jgi:hypothetical protein